MSPSAIGPPPHTRAQGLNAPPPVAAVNSIKVNKVDGLWALNKDRVFPHIEDLLSVRPGLDQNMPMRRLLLEAESFAKQAETQLDFRRPDMALQEYLKASIVLVEMVRNHKDYPGLQADRGDLHRLYNGLTKRISSQNDQFTKVKELIKENNTRHATQRIISDSMDAVSEKQQPALAHNHSRAVSTQKASGMATTALVSPRKKPVIQPKPDALQGKAISLSNPSGPTPTSPSVDLATRFARLRGPETKAPSSIQDPRIKTHPINFPYPLDSNRESRSSSPSLSNHTSSPQLTGPREMPSAPKTSLQSTRPSIDVVIPDMPKAPDPIYTPTRGSDNIATAQLLTSMNRSSSYHSRTDSAPPISTVRPTPGVHQNRQDYFSLAHSSPQDSARKFPFIPDPPTVSAEQLMAIQSSRALRVLFVDVRSREEFNSGHILSSAIICVEPITLEHGISGDRLEETLVLAPEAEQKLYEQRAEFDLVVFYDQSSTSLNSSTPLHNFCSAIYDYGYDKRVKRKPLLLHGGLDAWIDLLGPSSLETTGGPLSLGHSTAGRGIQRYSNKRRKVVYSRPLSKEEEKSWEKTLHEDSLIVESGAVAGPKPDSDDLLYVTTTEDFLRKYPELPAIQESMITEYTRRPIHRSYEDEISSTMPTPPTRPAPALPRQRSSGISERGPIPIATYAHTTDTISKVNVQPGLTGLANGANYCYMNSALQGISATVFLRDLLRNFVWPQPLEKQLPRSQREDTAPPQLMVRCLGNVMSHLWSQQYDYIKPQTLIKYINSVACKQFHANLTRPNAFGGLVQHDSAEFLRWFLDILHDELNYNRNQHDPQDQNELWGDRLNKMDPIEAVKENLARYQQYNRSQLTGSMLHGRIDLFECKNCGLKSRNIQGHGFTHNLLTLTVPTSPPSIPFNTLVQQLMKEELEKRCSGCNRDTPHHREMKFVYLSEYLIVELGRFRSHSVNKIMTQVTFGNVIDLSQFVLDTSYYKGDLPSEMRKPARYEVYATIEHTGTTIESGHYQTLAKHLDQPTSSDAAGAWHRYNDRDIGAAKFSDTQLAGGNKTAGILFLRKVK